MVFITHFTNEIPESFSHELKIQNAEIKFIGGNQA